MNESYLDISESIESIGTSYDELMAAAKSLSKVGFDENLMPNDYKKDMGFLEKGVKKLRLYSATVYGCYMVLRKWPSKKRSGRAQDHRRFTKGGVEASCTFRLAGPNLCKTILNQHLSVPMNSNPWIETCGDLTMGWGCMRLEPVDCDPMDWDSYRCGPCGCGACGLGPYGSKTLCVFLPSSYD